MTTVSAGAPLGALTRSPTGPAEELVSGTQLPDWSSYTASASRSRSGLWKVEARSQNFVSHFMCRRPADLVRFQRGRIAGKRACIVAERSLLRVMIVDDELLARVRLEDMLANESNVEVVGTATDGDSAVEMILELRPDLVFLDVQMPGRNGFEVVRAIGTNQMPMTIFVTAFDHYALQAFDVTAVDYLVKPFDDERFEQAFSRARRLLHLEKFGELREQMKTLLELEPFVTPLAAPTARDQPAQTSSSKYLERIAVDTRGKVRVVQVDDIDYISSSGPYAELHVAGKRMLIREAMQNLESRLDPEKFFRVHRSAIVRLQLVDTLHKGPGGDYELQLKDGTRLRVSRSRREALELWLSGGGI